MKFDELYLSGAILDAIDAMHFENCTPIQEKTIPLITEGRDLIAVAQTGTGKTAAYLLPVIDEIAMGDYPQDAINCIVMAPTRELAQQIDQQMQGFAYFMPVNSVAIYGGTDGQTFEQQKKGLKLGADIVIATPGRLIAHISMGYVDLSKVSFLILDEADRMLDMGFYDDIMQIVKLLPKERQTLLFSATMPPKIKMLAQNILRDPAEVKLSVSKPAEKIDQSAYILYETQKLPVLRHVFKNSKSSKSIVFASSKLKCKELSKTLRGLNLSVGEMHSDLDQNQREEMLLAFKSGKKKILVATDIMARGIDIDDIDLVVNYDVPHECEDYVHRVGRTARAEKDGVAITFVAEKEIVKFKAIERFIGKEIRKNEVPSDLGGTPAYDGLSPSGGRKKKKSSGKKGTSQAKKEEKPSEKSENKPQAKEEEKKEGARKRKDRRKKKGADSVSGSRRDATSAAVESTSGNKENKEQKPSEPPVSQRQIREAMAAEAARADAEERARLIAAAEARRETQNQEKPGTAETRHSASEAHPAPESAGPKDVKAPKRAKKPRNSRKPKATYPVQDPAGIPAESTTAEKRETESAKPRKRRYTRRKKAASASGNAAAQLSSPAAAASSPIAAAPSPGQAEPVQTGA